MAIFRKRFYSTTGIQTAQKRFQIKKDFGDIAEVVLEQLQNPLDKSIAQVESLLEDALTVEACYGESVPLYAVADLLPEYWSDFIRKGDIEDVKPLGIKPLGK